YDADDRLAGDTYDQNGNTTGSGGFTYTYDFENHLISRNGSPSIQISYDGDGNRVSKTIIGTGATTYFLIDDKNPTGYPQAVEELSGATIGTATLTTNYVFGQRLISQKSGSTVQYYCHDGQGSTRLLVDSSGGVLNTFTYDAFGIQIASAQ